MCDSSCGQACWQGQQTLLPAQHDAEPYDSLALRTEYYAIEASEGAQGIKPGFLVAEAPRPRIDFLPKRSCVAHRQQLSEQNLPARLADKPVQSCFPGSPLYYYLCLHRRIVSQKAAGRVVEAAGAAAHQLAGIEGTFWQSQATCNRPAKPRACTDWARAGSRH